MEPQHIAWIAALVASSVIPKFAGLLVKKRDLGLIMGPLVGVIGGVGLWQGVVALGQVPLEDAVVAGVLGGIGSLVLYLIGVALKK